MALTYPAIAAWGQRLPGCAGRPQLAANLASSIQQANGGKLVLALVLEAPTLPTPQAVEAIEYSATLRAPGTLEPRASAAEFGGREDQGDQELPELTPFVALEEEDGFVALG